MQKNRNAKTLYFYLTLINNLTPAATRSEPSDLRFVETHDFSFIHCTVSIYYIHMIHDITTFNGFIISMGNVQLLKKILKLSHFPNFNSLGITLFVVKLPPSPAVMISTLEKLNPHNTVRITQAAN